MPDATDDLQERLRNNPRLNDPRSTEELLQTALTEEDENRYRDAISTLHFRPAPDVFETARRLCESEDPGEREVGADILGQLGCLSACALIRRCRSSSGGGPDAHRALGRRG